MMMIKTLKNKILKEDKKLKKLLTQYRTQDEVRNSYIDELIPHIIKTEEREKRVKGEDGKYKTITQIYQYIEYTQYFDCVDDDNNVVDKMPINLKMYIKSNNESHYIEYDHIMELITEKRLIF